MSHIGKADSERQATWTGGLHASWACGYPKSMHGPVRRLKRAVLVTRLAIYCLLPWLRWPRGTVTGPLLRRILVLLVSARGA